MDFRLSLSGAALRPASCSAVTPSTNADRKATRAALHAGVAPLALIATALILSPGIACAADNLLVGQGGNGGTGYIDDYVDAGGGGGGGGIGGGGGGTYRHGSGGGGGISGGIGGGSGPMPHDGGEGGSGATGGAGGDYGVDHYSGGDGMLGGGGAAYMGGGGGALGGAGGQGDALNSNAGGAAGVNADGSGADGSDDDGNNSMGHGGLYGGGGGADFAGGGGGGTVVDGTGNDISGKTQSAGASGASSLTLNDTRSYDFVGVGGGGGGGAGGVGSQGTVGEAGTAGTLTLGDGAVLTVNRSVLVGGGGGGAGSRDGGAGGAGALILESGSSLNVSETLLVGGSGGGGASDFDNTTGVGGSGGNGTLTVETGASVNLGAGGRIILGGDNGGDSATSGGAAGSGQLTLSGTASAANITEGDGGGQLIFDGGTFRLVADQASLFDGFETGDITLQAGGGTIDTNGFDATSALGLRGTGDLSKDGAGTLTLSGTNAYTGDTTVHDGTLVIKGTSTHGAGDYYIGRDAGDDGTLVIRDGGSLSNSDSYIGEEMVSVGWVTVTGAGSTWTTSGNLHLNDGTLTIAEGGLVRVGGGTGIVELNDDLHGTTKIYIGATAGIAPVAPGTLDAGDVDFSTGGGMIVFNHTADDYTFAPSIKGMGTVNYYAGTTIHTGNNTYVGDTGVDGGTVILEGQDTHGTGRYLIGESNGRSSALIVRGGGSLANDVGFIGSLSGATGAVTVTGTDSAWANAGFLRVGESGHGTLTISDSGSVSNAAGYVGNKAGSTGKVIVTDPNSRWTNGGELYVGVFGAGDLTIAKGGTVTVEDGVGVVHVAYNSGSTGSLNIGAAAGAAAVGAGILDAAEVSFGDGNATLSFNHTDTAYSFAPQITGAGALDHHAGTTILTADNIYTGDTTVHGGTLVIEGASDQGTGSYIVGDNSGDDAALTVQNGGDVRNRTGYIGRDAGATGGVTVTGANSTWTSTGNLRVGQSGSGTLTIADGGSASSDTSYIGENVDATGTVTVDGTNSRWTNERVFIGSWGTGALTVTDAGSVSTDFGYIGVVAGSSGTVTVTGAGSSWTSTSEVDVGLEGSGTLTIAAGGSVSSAGAYIGARTDSTGTVAVTGEGSTLASSNSLNVGRAGTGTLAISGGGSVSNGDGYIGWDSGASGVVTVTGTGSNWANSTALFVGMHGNGALTVADGSLVSVGDGAGGKGVVNLAVAGGSTGALSIGAAAGDAAAGAGTLEVAGVSFGDGNATLSFNHTDTGYTFAPKITGSGTLEQWAGTTILTADNSDFDGTASVLGGTLAVDGALGAVTAVADRGTLTGAGNIAAAVTVASGGKLVGVQGRTLSVQSLSLDAGAAVTAAFGTPDASGPLFDVTGDLSLDGTLQVSDLGGLSAGVYSLMRYGGALTDGGLEIGAVPAGTSASDFAVQTAVAGTVNLVSSVGAELNFWDGGDATLYDNGSIDGGAGTWRGNGRAWTNAAGTVNGAITPVPAFAVFDGAGGAIVLDDEVGALSASGLQFASDGYSLVGDALTLVGAGGESIVRVGDGSAAGAAYRATIAAALGGDTRLVKTDLGTLVLLGANSYTDGTEVKAGTLIGSAASIRGDLVSDGTTVFDEAGQATFAGAISGTGALVKRGAGTLTLAETSSADWHVAEGGLVASSERFTGDLAVDAGATMTFAQEKDAVYAGRVSGAGRLVFTGSGHVRLTGDSSAFAGAATMETGTLSVDGELAGRLVLGEGARLEGTGTLGDAALAGTLAPGHSIGTLTFTGDVTLADTATYEVEVDASGASDRIVVGGAATIEGGAVLALAAAGDYRPETAYTILSADGGIEGTFADVSSNLTFLEASLGYSAEAVTLTLTRNDIDFAAVAASPNQRAVAAAVEALGAGSPLYGAVVKVDAAGARHAFDQLSGAGHASLSATMLDDTRLAREAMLQRASADAGLWGSVLGSWSTTDGNGNAAGHERSVEGFQMGFDRSAGEHWRLGLSFGYLRRDIETERGFAASIEGYTFGAYAAGRYGRLSLALGMGGGWHDAVTERSVRIGALAETEHGRYGASAAQAFAEAGWQVTDRGLALTPYARLAHAALHVRAFREEGGAAALAGEDNDLCATFVEVGARAASAKPLELAGVDLTVSGRAGLRRAFGDTRPAIAARLGSAGFTAAGTPIARTAALVELRLDARLGDSLHLGLAYTGQHGGRTSDHGAKTTLSWTF